MRISETLSAAERCILCEYAEIQIPKKDSKEKSEAVRAESLLMELLQYREVTEVCAGIHFSPFCNVPSSLMKRIDWVTINQLCEQKQTETQTEEVV